MVTLMAIKVVYRIHIHTYVIDNCMLVLMLVTYKLISSFSNFLTFSNLVRVFRLTAPAAVLGHLGAISLKNLTKCKEVRKGADQAKWQTKFTKKYSNAILICRIRSFTIAHPRLPSLFRILKRFNCRLTWTKAAKCILSLS